MSFVPSVSDFRQYFGNIFSDAMLYPDAIIQQNLDENKIEVSELIFRNYYRRALYFLTAHYLCFFIQTQTSAEATGDPDAFSSAKGVVSSASVGDLSLSQEMPEYTKSSDDKFLASTRFGQEFVRLRNKMSKGGLLANKPLWLGGIV